MVNLVITLRHALKYRGGRVVQRVARRVARDQRGIVDGEKSRCEDVEREETEREDRNGKGRKGVEKKCDRFRWQNYKKPCQSWPKGGKIEAKIGETIIPSPTFEKRIELEGRSLRIL